MIDRDSDSWLSLSEPYVCGKCMYLACALNERYGWPISAQIDSNGVEEYISHAWVVTDNGLNYDVDGFKNDLQLDDYCGELVEALSMADILSINMLNGDTEESFKKRVQEAHEFVDDYLQSELPELNYKKRA